jgi:hypothetical protein
MACMTIPPTRCGIRMRLAAKHGRTVEEWSLPGQVHVACSQLFPIKGNGCQFSFASMREALQYLLSTYLEVSNSVKITFKVASPGPQWLCSPGLG